jgi:hypothetical protein
MQISPEQLNSLTFDTNNDKKLTAFEFALPITHYVASSKYLQQHQAVC